MIDNKTLDTTSISGGGKRFSALIKTLATPKFLFFLFFFIYVLIGFYVSFDSIFLIKHIDIYVDADVIKYVRILDKPNITTGFIFKHPLYVFFVYPFVMLLKGIIHDKRLAIIVFQALTSSASVCFMFGITNILSKNKKLALLTTFIYGFGFSSLIYTAIFEAYSYSAFFGLLLLYYCICLVDRGVKKLSVKDVFILGFCGVGTFAIVGSNIVCFVFALIYLLYKMHDKNIKPMLIDLSKILLFFAGILVYTMLYTKLCMPHSSFFFEYSGVKMIKDFWGQAFSVKELLIQDFIAPFTAVDWTINPRIHVKTIPKIILGCNMIKLIIPTLALYIVSFVIGVKNFKNMKYKFFWLICFMILLIHFIYSCNFNSRLAFLFVHNYFYILVLVLGIIWFSVADRFKPALYTFLSLFLGYQIFANPYIIVQMRKYVLLFDAAQKFGVGVMALYSFLITLLLWSVCFFVQKVISKDLLTSSFRDKYFVGILLFLLIGTVSMSFYGMCWWRL